MPVFLLGRLPPRRLWHQSCASRAGWSWILALPNGHVLLVVLELAELQFALRNGIPRLRSGCW